uniref:Uncharacterized protein n=1 Tax=Strongyloides stercoralis TaxID=6248 RepID=A0A0K0E9S8_STRER
MLWSLLMVNLKTLKKRQGYNKEEHFWTNEESYLQLETFFVPTITFIIQVIIRQTPYSALIKEYWRFLRLKSERAKLMDINFDNIENILHQIKEKAEKENEEVISNKSKIETKSFTQIENDGVDLIGKFVKK